MQKSTHRMGLGCGSWSRILYAYSKKEHTVWPNTETRGFYNAMVNRGIFEKESDFKRYRLSKGGIAMAEWILAVLPQNQVRIRFKHIQE